MKAARRFVCLVSLCILVAVVSGCGKKAPVATTTCGHTGATATSSAAAADSAGAARVTQRGGALQPEDARSAELGASAVGYLLRPRRVGHS
jgi:hypothetical protein